MQKESYYKYGLRQLLLLAMAALWIWGCVPSQKAPAKDPFFDQWREMAKTSQGYSPSAQKKTMDLPEIEKGAKAAGTQPAEIPKRPLPTAPVTLSMHNVEVATLLRALARSANQNIVISEKVQGKTSIFLERAPWNQAFETILRTNGLTYTWEGDIIRILTVADMEIDLKRETQRKGLQLVEPLITRIIPIEYSDVNQMKKNFENLLTKNNEDKQIGAVMVDEHNNALVIQAIASDMERITALIEALDMPTPQILIEAKIVETTSETARDLGIEWGGLMNNGDLWVYPGANSTGVTGNQLSSGGIDPTSAMAAVFPADLTGGAGFALGFALEKAGEKILAAQLSALEEEGKLNILSSPSITTIDNKAALIESGDEVPFQTTDSNGNISVEYKKAVLSLQVTPHVIEGDTLKLNILTSKDELDFTRTVSGNPTIITKKAETNVILYDGQTTVIAGLTKKTQNEGNSGIPALKDIPILGYLFKGESKDDKMEDILIFITPHILKERVPPNQVQAEPQKEPSQAVPPAPVEPSAAESPAQVQSAAEPEKELIQAEAGEAPAPPTPVSSSATQSPPPTQIAGPGAEPIIAASAPIKELPPSQPAAAGPTGPMAIQIGDFPIRKQAAERMAQLKTYGYDTYLLIALDETGKTHYAVRTGEYKNLTTAMQAKRQMEQRLPFAAAVAPVNSLTTLGN